MPRRVFRKRNPRRPRRKAPKRRGTFATKQMATIQETLEFADLEVNSAYNLSFSLSQFERAMALAPNFKWVKATKVEWNLEPIFNVYTETTGALESIPYLYTRMNRTQDGVSVTKSDLQAMGAKPQKFTSKKVLKYVPNWCSPGLVAQTVDANGAVIGLQQQGLKAQYSYLPSPGDNPGINVGTGMVPIDGRAGVIPFNSGMTAVTTNSIRYNGTDLYFDQAFFQGTSTVCRVTCTVTWTFRDPNFNGFVRLPVPVEPKQIT